MLNEIINKYINASSSIISLSNYGYFVNDNTICFLINLGYVYNMEQHKDWFNDEELENYNEILNSLL